MLGDMAAPPVPTPPSLKRQMIDLLDKYLLGQISSRDLIRATVPMLMLSAHKRGRKSYIEKLLMDLSAKEETQITREYIYAMRETIIGETAINEKDRKKVFKRTVRKLIERLLFEEIDINYFLSTAFDLMTDYHDAIEGEPAFAEFFDQIRSFSEAIRNRTPENKAGYAALAELILNFYQEQYKTLWDE